MAVGRTRHRVTATMIVARVPGAQGGEVYLRQGRLLPESVETAEVKRLTGLGLVEKITVDDVPATDDSDHPPAGD